MKCRCSSMIPEKRWRVCCRKRLIWTCWMLPLNMTWIGFFLIAGPISTWQCANWFMRRLLQDDGMMVALSLKPNSRASFPSTGQCKCSIKSCDCEAWFWCTQVPVSSAASWLAKITRPSQGKVHMELKMRQATWTWRYKVKPIKNDSWMINHGKRARLGPRWLKMDELTLVKVDQKVTRWPKSTIG